MILPKLYILETEEKGRGVYSSVSFTPGDLIEICPTIVCPPSDYEKIHSSYLHDYYFLWGDNYDHLAIALGYGSIYNHSSKPNARMQMDLEKSSLDVYCVEQINPGDEIVFNYQDNDQVKLKLWFKEK